jgi:hypothetical protein
VAAAGDDGDAILQSIFHPGKYSGSP